MEDKEMKRKTVFLMALFLLVPILGYADSGDAFSTANDPATGTCRFRVGAEGNLAKVSTITCNGNQTVAGTLAVTGNTTISGTLAVTGAVTATGLPVASKEAVKGIGGATSLTPITVTYPIVVISSGSSAITSIATPFISTATATYPEGSYVIIRGSGMASITIQDEPTNSVESGLRLGASTRVINQNDEIGLRLMWDDTDKRYYWVEQYYRDYSGETMAFGNTGGTALDARMTITGGEAKYASVRLQADQSDDSGDDWELRAGAGDEERLYIMNDNSGAAVVVTTISNAGNVSTWGDINLEGGDLTVKNIANDSAATISLISDNGDDAGDTWKLRADTSENLLIMNDQGGNANVVVGTVTNGGNMAVTGTVTGSICIGAGNRSGMTNVNGQTVYKLVIATSVVDTLDYTPSEVDGKAGWGTIACSGGAFGATFTFETDGSVNLGVSSGTAASNGNDGTLNVYDGGTGIALENQTGSTATIYGEIYYIN